MGDWAAFLGTTKDAAIRAALAGRFRWETERYGPYSILTGTVTEVVAVPQRYTLLKLKEGDEACPLLKPAKNS